ncbi:bacteriohemerythrin [Dongia sp.]|uniref:bacteriohemerythrin n=1 Tax=Dongia sp. TaxID=1977262 RepID=UPI0035B092A5
MYALNESLVTGIESIDGEHHDLVALLNIVDVAANRGEVDEVRAALENFRRQLGDHFVEEELYLSIIRYPQLDAHAEQHAETLSSIDRLIAALPSSRAELQALSRHCFHVLLHAVLSMDLHVAEWQRKAARIAPQDHGIQNPDARDQPHSAAADNISIPADKAAE